MADEEIRLPKTTLIRAIKDRLPENMRSAADANEMIMRGCQEFILTLSSTANALSEKEKKNTITPEHVLKSLEDLGYTEWMDELNTEYTEWKDVTKEAKQQEKTRKAARNATEMTQEQLLAYQQKLFAEARERTLAAPLSPTPVEPELEELAEQEQQSPPPRPEPAAEDS